MASKGRKQIDYIIYWIKFYKAFAVCNFIFIQTKHNTQDETPPPPPENGAPAIAVSAVREIRHCLEMVKIYQQLKNKFEGQLEFFN